MTIKQVIKTDFLKTISAKTLRYQLSKKIIPKYFQIEEVQQTELCWEQLLAIRHKPPEPRFWEGINSSVLLT